MSSVPTGAMRSADMDTNASTISNGTILVNVNVNVNAYVHVILNVNVTVHELVIANVIVCQSTF